MNILSPSSLPPHVPALLDKATAGTLLSSDGLPLFLMSCPQATEQILQLFPIVSLFQPRWVLKVEVCNKSQKPGSDWSSLNI